MSLALSSGFPPLEGEIAHTLILGSLPGVASITAQQYYAHPRNAFWPIMEKLYGVRGDYTTRAEQLVDCGVAVWDVLQQALRPGSLDVNISPDSATPNDFQAFFRRHQELRRIVCNGATSMRLFQRLVECPASASVVRLPSTSPAHAAMSFDQKYAAWHLAIKSA